jgi:hypothetical protein
MLARRPNVFLPVVSVPALVATSSVGAADDEAARDVQLELCDALRLFRGRVRLVRYPAAAQNLARYVPRELTLELAGLLLLGCG